MVATPSSLRRANQRTLIGLLLRGGAASRADLAKAAGMSQPTAGKIVDELLESGVLETVGSPLPPLPPLPPGPSLFGRNGADGRPSRLGRPGRMLRLNQTEPRFVAIQLGIAHTRIAMLPVAIPAEDQWTVTVTTPRSAQQWVRTLERAAARLPGRHPWGVVLSIPGVVDEPGGQVLLAPNLHWIERAKLPELLRHVWEAPAVLVQEIRALALGHLVIGKGERDFLLVDFEHGVGAAAVLDGKLFSGARPLSGELGHTPVLGNDRPCGCGAVGCVETLVSRRGLLQTFAEQHGGSPDWPSLVRQLSRDPRGLPSWLRRSLDAAATAIAGALNVLGLRRVVFTGCLTELPQQAVQHLSDAVTRGAMWARFGEVHCQAAPRHWTAGLAATAIDRLLLPETAPGLGGAALHSRKDRSYLGAQSGVHTPSEPVKETLPCPR